MDQNQHPIEGLMETAMESIKTMVDVNTILGDPVETPDGSVIIPVSRVSLGFAAGGTEYEGADKGRSPQASGGGEKFPFGGGSGAGISVNPVAFLVVGHGQPRLMPVDNNVVVDRLLDLAPQLIDQLRGKTTARKANGHYESSPID